MAWDNIDIKNVQKIEYGCYLKTLVIEMMDNIEKMKRNIKTSDTYENWAESLDNGISEMESSFFSIIREAGKIAHAGTLRLDISLICQRKCENTNKELCNMVKECIDVVNSEIDILELCFAQEEPDMLRGLLYKGSIFQLLANTICWMADEAFNKLKGFGVGYEQLFEVICKSIRRFAYYDYFRNDNGKFDSTVMALDRKIENGIISHPISTFMVKQAASWQSVRQQKIN